MEMILGPVKAIAPLDSDYVTILGSRWAATLENTAHRETLTTRQMYASPKFTSQICERVIF